MCLFSERSATSRSNWLSSLPIVASDGVRSRRGGVLLLPDVEGLLGDAQLPAHITGEYPAVGWPEGIDDLFPGILRPIYGSTPFVEDH